MWLEWITSFQDYKEKSRLISLYGNAKIRSGSI